MHLTEVARKVVRVEVLLAVRTVGLAVDLAVGHVLFLADALFNQLGGTSEKEGGKNTRLVQASPTARIVNRKDDSL